MLSANCPTCGSAIQFRHAAALTVVCESCSSSVVRDGINLSSYGKVSAVARDLSVVRLGAQGSWGGLDFVVVGVLRKGRDRVRWCEWFVAFHDGSFGWLAEGNAEFQVFRHDPVVEGLPHPNGLTPGHRLTIGDTAWRVVERATARVVAAEGELPFALGPDTTFTYADMRSVDGQKSATLDRDAAGHTQLWVGEVVELSALSMRGLRPFTGWMDGSAAQFRGPDVSASRSLKCPKCAAPLALRAPGSTVKVGCQYCGSELGVAEGGEGQLALQILKARSSAPFTPSLPLGSKGELGGRAWQIIGAQVRFVMSEGTPWSWTEYLLHNPYHGFAFLVEDPGSHWSLVRKTPDLPGTTGRRAEYRGKTFRSFQDGVAEVRHVLGEFYWEVHSGDRAYTHDYVAPPFMLSSEVVKDEISWTLGSWLSAEDVAAAFGKESLRRPEGVAPHQPNPWDSPGSKGIITNGLVILLAVLITAVAGALFMFPERTLHEQSWLPQAQSSSVWISEAFEVSGGLRRDLGVEGVVPLHRQHGTLHVALIDLDHNTAYLPEPRRTNPGRSVSRVESTVFRVQPGRYVARVELSTPKDGADRAKGKRVDVKVTLHPRWWSPAVWAGLLVIGLPLFRMLGGSFFENRRWQASEHTGGGAVELMLSAGAGVADVVGEVAVSAATDHW